MGKKSGPPPPDYQAIAQTQGQQSQQNTTQQTWANRPDQSSPFGNVSWGAQTTTDPATGQKVTKWTQNTSLDPNLQSALNSQIATEQGRSDLANSFLPRLQQSMGQSLDFSGFTPMAQGPQATSAQAYGVPQAMSFGAQPINTGLQEGPKLNTQLGQGAGQIQGNLNFGGLQNVSNAADTRARAENALYSAQTSRLDPQFADKQAQLETQLANQGISRNSDAYSRAMRDFNFSRNDAYLGARNAAISGGGAEAQRDYSMDLGLRQQQAQEAMNQGNFANAAQAQGFGQDLAAGQANNAALGQQFGFGQSALQNQLAAQNALFNQQLQGGSTAYQQQLAGQNQAFNQQLASQGQGYQQQLQSANYQNQFRQQQIAEALQQRSLPLNEMNALLNGQQISNPQFTNFATAGQAQTPDMLGAAQAQYSAALNGQSNRNSLFGNLVGAIGQGLGTYFSSDPRVKRDARKLRRDPRGFNVWSFRYVGEHGRRVGVMADEVARVMPQAVRNLQGLTVVDYGLIGEIAA